ncbi:malonate transporter subunit MadL [Pseudomonas sp. BN417]|uniref:malonate transporter subunit MadL n=1 Tax=Pseudomonas sp. BN417 TaxID=2567890 RepID=UPI0024540D05|nr:malonate transporter subunit MadL [Pseudomonas sp. BN417]MDH4557762.1 malonate transporter subunit MadL [Pseudomonas sp. BN417]
MIVYGVALLAICTLAGVIIGDFLGVLLGVKSNVGGVGIAMILLIFARLYMHRHGGLSKECEFGVGFWGAMYIPVVVAMAAQQNVVTALHGGPVALIAAVGSVLLCGATIALISRTNKGAPLEKEPLDPGVSAAPAGGR